MLPRIVFIFSVMLLAVKSRPFYGTGGRRKSGIQKDWSLDGAHPVHYPLLPFPVRQSEMFSDLSSLPIRQSSMQFSDMLNRVRKDKITSGATFNEALQDFDQKTAQMVDHFGQRVRATVRQYEEGHGERMQNVGKIMEQFKLDEVKDRLKKTLTDQKGLLKKLHSIGWRGKYIGVPYDTMNDDHTIVKKPGVYITSLSQPNAVLVAPAIQSIAMEHPALPEVTTSVYFHQESERTATTDDYVLPPEVNETTEISNSINDAEGLTTSKETIILQEDTRTERSPRIEEKLTTIEIGPTFSSTTTIMDEENTSLDIVGYTNATEIISRYQSTFLNEVIPGTEGTSSPVPETTQVPSEVTPITETASTSTTRDPGITSEIISTFSSIFSTEEPVATSDGVSTVMDTVFGLVIDEEGREPTTEIVTTYPPEISTKSTSWPTTDSITPVVEVLSGLDYNASPSFLDVIETSTGVGSTLLFSTIPTESTTTKADGEEIEEIITSSTEESETLEEVSVTTDPVHDPFMTNGNTIAYSLMTLTSTIPPETTFWQPITHEGTTRIESTFASMIASTEIYSTANERFTTIDSDVATTAWEEISTVTALDSSTIDSGSAGATSTTLSPAVYEPTFEIDIRHIETGTTFPATITTQATSTFHEIPTTKSSPRSSSSIDAEITKVLDDATIFEGNYLTGSTIEMKTTTATNSELFLTNPIESNAVETERSTALYSGFDRPTIDTDIENNTETASTLQSTISTEKTTSLEEIPEGIRTIGAETTSETLLPFYHTITKGTTAAFDESFTTTTKSSIENETPETSNSYFGMSTTVHEADGLMTGEETPEIKTTFPVTVSTEETTTVGFEETQDLDTSTKFEDHSVQIETTTFADLTIFSTLVTKETRSLISVDPASESPIINVESITEVASTSPILTEKTTALEGIPTIADSYSGTSTSGVETTTEILLPSFYNILTQSTTTSEQLSAATTETLIDRTSETISKVRNEVTTTSNPGITTLSDYVPRFVDDYLPSSTTEVETTDVVDSTFYSTNPTEPNTISAGNLPPIINEETTSLNEIPAITDSSFGIPTIDEGKTPEILLPFSYSSTVPIESTLTFDELSTTTTESPIDSSSIDEEATEVISTFETTTTSAFEITTPSYISPKFLDNYLTDIRSTTESVSTPIDEATPSDAISTTDSHLDSTTIGTGTYSQFISPSNEIPMKSTASSIASFATEEETFSEMYSIFFSTNSMDTVEITTVIPEFDSLTINTKSTSGILSTISPPISTEKTTTLGDISATTVSSLESSTIDEETTTVIIPTVTTTSFEDISEATDMGTNSVTDDGETTTEIVPTFSPTLSTETSVESVSTYNFEARSESGDLNENFNPVLPEFARAAIEEPDVKTLLNLIPLIIEELRKNNLSTAEIYTLRQVFGNIWPLLEEESDRKPGEAVNHKLAILLHEAGQRLSKTDRPIY